MYSIARIVIYYSPGSRPKAGEATTLRPPLLDPGNIYIYIYIMCARFVAISIETSGRANRDHPSRQSKTIKQILLLIDNKSAYLTPLPFPIRTGLV